MFHIAHVNEGRDECLLLLLQTQHGSYAGRLKIFVQLAAAHDVDITLTVLRRVRVHRADQRTFFSTLTQLRQLST